MYMSTLLHFKLQHKKLVGIIITLLAMKFADLFQLSCLEFITLVRQQTFLILFAVIFVQRE